MVLFRKHELFGFDVMLMPTARVIDAASLETRASFADGWRHEIVEEHLQS
ncbi:hypothetical protein [Rhodococcus sp. OK302]|nr:hypothetical protein [Rhodococcus sp. OK302]